MCTKRIVAYSWDVDEGSQRRRGTGKSLITGKFTMVIRRPTKEKNLADSLCVCGSQLAEKKSKRVIMTTLGAKVRIIYKLSVLPSARKVTKKTSKTKQKTHNRV